MKNPYQSLEVSSSRVIAGKGTCVVLTLLFLLCILAFPTIRHQRELGKPVDERWLPLVELWTFPNERAYNLLFLKKLKNDKITRERPSLRDHLQGFEDGLEDTDLRRHVSAFQQKLLVRFLGTGNRKVIIGRDGWLYYRASVDAVTGRGSIDPPVDIANKDPDRPLWRSPLDVIESFSRDLEDRGVKLMIVPVPSKPVIQSNGFGVEDPMRHSDELRLIEGFRERQIAVVDLYHSFIESRSREEVYLRQDTHWKARFAELAAQRVADEVRAREDISSGESNFPEIQRVSTLRGSRGDLVEMLRIPKNSNLFEPELQEFDRILELETGRALEGDLSSPITVLGDSFVNIYEEPGLGFGDPEDQGLIGGGFASHLSVLLRHRLHVLAINGEGATGVRRAFAALPDNVVRSKKVVIWLIAFRDLLLSETAANRFNVFWSDVEFNPEREEGRNQNRSDLEGFENGERLRLSGVVMEKSAIPSPDQTPYKDAIFSVIFDDLSLEAGAYPEKEILVFFWAFQNRKYTEWSKLKIGERYRLDLVPLSKSPRASRVTQLDDFSYQLERLELDPYWIDDSFESKKR